MLKLNQGVFYTTSTTNDLEHPKIDARMLHFTILKPSTLISLLYIINAQPSLFGTYLPRLMRTFRIGEKTQSNTTTMGSCDTHEYYFNK